MEAYLPMFKDALNMFLFLGVELSVLFILISAGVSLLQQYIPDYKIQALLSGGHARGYILAALLGSVTPFCSCSTIPMLRGFLKAKVGFGPTLTFLFTSPLLNPIIVGLFVVTFGLKVTVIYVAIGFAVAVLAGLTLDKTGFEKYVIPENKSIPTAACCAGETPASGQKPVRTIIPMAPKESCCPQPQILPMASCCSPQPDQNVGCCPPKPIVPLMLKPKGRESSCCGTSIPEAINKDNCCGESPEKEACCDSLPKETGETFPQKLKIAFDDGWKQFKVVLPYLLVGVGLGAFIYGFVPGNFIAAHAGGNNPLAVPIAAVIGIPLYVRAETLIPLSAALASKGMSLGAVMALIIGGAGASLTEVILLKSIFKIQMVIAFLAVIIGMAIFAGYFFQLLL